MISIKGGPPELDISFSRDISQSGDHLNWLTPDSTTSSRALPLWRPMARDYVIPLLEISPEKEISNSGGPPLILIIFLVTFPQPVTSGC